MTVYNKLNPGRLRGVLSEEIIVGSMSEADGNVLQLEGVVVRGELSGQVGADAIWYTMLSFSIICSPFPWNRIAHLHLPQCYCNFLWEEDASLPIDIRFMPTYYSNSRQKL